MTVNAVCQSIQQYIPTQEAVVQKFSTMIPNMARNLTKIAVPTVVMLGLSLVEGADAGPLMYASCMVGCAAMGAFAPACWPACIPLLAVPGP